ncbi:choice-of-anchor B family protein [bacterium]|nr:choice-of-anchor B family protein [bacterium]
MNRKHYILFACLLVVAAAKAQNFGLDSLSTWSRPGLPVDDFQSYSDIWGWHDGNGREYAIMGSLDSIYFIEVTQPEKPVLRDAEVGKQQHVIHRDFKTYQNYCYAVGDEGFSSLQIFDLSYLPDSVHKVYDSDKLLKRTHNIFIDGDRLYLGTCRLRNDKLIPMRILSIKDPENPVLLCDVFAPDVLGQRLFNEVHDMYVKHDTIFCSTGYDGLYVLKYVDSTRQSQGDSSWKIFDPHCVVVDYGAVVKYPGNGYNHSSWLSNNSKYLVMADETPGTKLKIVHFPWDDLPEISSTFGVGYKEGSLPHNPFILHKMAIISYYHEGVVVFDISKPESPRLMAQFDTYPDNTDFHGMYGCWGVYPFLPSGHIIASDQLYGLFVFDKITATGPDVKNDLQFEVFPNPATEGYFQIKFYTGTEGVVNIAVFNASGQCILRDVANGSQWVFNKEQSLGSGLYVVQIAHQGRVYHRKVVVK